MSSDIEKFLAKLIQKEKKILDNLIEKIIKNDLKGLDVRKLSGRDDVFMVRRRNFRIIFKITKTDNKVVSVERRNDTTYRL
jgi:mRNA-degrading endonuclease RelE of RelBE toxin-antitoxin system